MNAFYVIYYTGAEGSGSMSMLMKDSHLYGVEASGGIIKGSYTKGNGGAVACKMTFNFEKGVPLVTGQTLQEDLSVPFEIEIAQETLGGATQRANFPTGLVNFRMEKLVDI